MLSKEEVSIVHAMKVSSLGLLAAMISTAAITSGAAATAHATETTADATQIGQVNVTRNDRGAACNRETSHTNPNTELFFCEQVNWFPGDSNVYGAEVILPAAPKGTFTVKVESWSGIKYQGTVLTSDGIPKGEKKTNSGGRIQFDDSQISDSIYKGFRVGFEPGTLNYPDDFSIAVTQNRTQNVCTTQSAASTSNDAPSPPQQNNPTNPLPASKQSGSFIGPFFGDELTAAAHEMRAPLCLTIGNSGYVLPPGVTGGLQLPDELVHQIFGYQAIPEYLNPGAELLAMNRNSPAHRPSLTYNLVEFPVRFPANTALWFNNPTTRTTAPQLPQPPTETSNDEPIPTNYDQWCATNTFCVFDIEGPDHDGSIPLIPHSPKPDTSQDGSRALPSTKSKNLVILAPQTNDVTIETRDAHNMTHQVLIRRDNFYRVPDARTAVWARNEKH